MPRPKKDVVLDTTSTTDQTNEPVSTIEVVVENTDAATEESVVANIESTSTPYYFRIPLPNDYAILVEKPDEFFTARIFFEWQSNMVFLATTVFPPHATESTMIQITKRVAMSQINVWLQLVNRAITLEML